METPGAKVQCCRFRVSDSPRKPSYPKYWPTVTQSSRTLVDSSLQLWAADPKP